MAFEKCTFEHIGTYALEITTNVHHVLISHCAISDVGAGGIRINGENVVPVTETVPSNITISDCTITKYGCINMDAVGILLQFAHDCIISHNEISDGYYTGLSIGWRWGYGDHATFNILVEKNHIHNIDKDCLQT